MAKPTNEGRRKEMTPNDTRCEECGAANSHEIWCNFYLGPKGQLQRTIESTWTVETTYGTRPTFALAPNATFEVAENYTIKHIDQAVISTLKRLT